MMPLGAVVLAAVNRGDFYTGSLLGRFHCCAKYYRIKLEVSLQYRELKTEAG